MKNFLYREFLSVSKDLEAMGLKPYWGKGGNWFNIYHKDEKYFYSPTRGRFRKEKEEWRKIGGLASLVDFFKRDELKEQAKSILKEINDTYGTSRRVNKDLILLLALGKDKDYLLNRVGYSFRKYDKFEWYWFLDERLKRIF